MSSSWFSLGSTWMRFGNGATLFTRKISLRCHLWMTSRTACWCYWQTVEAAHLTMDVVHPSSSLIVGIHFGDLGSRCGWLTKHRIYSRSIGTDIQYGWCSYSLLMLANCGWKLKAKNDPENKKFLFSSFISSFHVENIFLLRRNSSSHHTGSNSWQTRIASWLLSQTIHSSEYVLGFKNREDWSKTDDWRYWLLRLLPDLFKLMLMSAWRLKKDVVTINRQMLIWYRWKKKDRGNSTFFLLSWTKNSLSLMWAARQKEKSSPFCQFI